MTCKAMVRLLEQSAGAHATRMAERGAVGIVLTAMEMHRSADLFFFVATFRRDGERRGARLSRRVASERSRRCTSSGRPEVGTGSSAFARRRAPRCRKKNALGRFEPRLQEHACAALEWMCAENAVAVLAGMKGAVELVCRALADHLVEVPWPTTP